MKTGLTIGARILLVFCCMAFLPLALSYQNAAAQGQSDDFALLNNGISVRLDSVTRHGDGTSTWNYVVRELRPGSQLNYWMLEMISCTVVLDTAGGEWVAADPLTGIPGLRWTVTEPFQVGTFSIKVSGQGDPLKRRVMALTSSPDTVFINGPGCSPDQPPGTTLTASPDHYTLVGAALTVPAPGVLSNDTTSNLAVEAVLEQGSSHGTVILNRNGGFTYTPQAGYFGEDSFTYRVQSGQLRSEPAQVTLAVGDDSPPSLTWEQPVGDRQRYDVFPGQLVLLRVAATDDRAVARVTYRRWDAVNSTYVELGEATTAPYEITFDTTGLNDGWNQVNAEAVDSAGNRGENHYIWLFRTDSGGELGPYVIYLPSVAR